MELPVKQRKVMGESVRQFEPISSLGEYFQTRRYRGAGFLVLFPDATMLASGEQDHALATEANGAYDLRQQEVDTKIPA